MKRLHLVTILITTVTAMFLAAGLAVADIDPALTYEDRSNINKLIYNYSYAMDSKDINKFAGLFTEDATYTFYLKKGMIVIEAADSREELVSLTQVLMDLHTIRGVQTRHYQTNTILELVSEDEVHGITMIQAVHQGRIGSPSVKFTGYYEDIIVRTADGWRFKQRNAFGDQP